MQKLLICVLGLAMSLGLGLTVRQNRGQAAIRGSQQASLANDASFRDGLFVGRFMAKQGRPMLAPVGRWSTKRDRASFLAGYQQGYASAETSARF